MDKKEKLIEALIVKFNEDNNVQIPPPVFEMMKGEVVDFSETQGFLKVKFPILKIYLNPFGNVQGGIIAAAIDNTFGPLSMLVAPLNYSHQLEITYKKPIESNLKYFIVIANFIERSKRRLYFKAKVLNSSEVELATAKSIHWILESK